MRVLYDIWKIQAEKNKVWGILVRSQKGPPIFYMYPVFEINGALAARWHISTAGRTFFGHVCQICPHFFTQLLQLYTSGVHRKIPGHKVKRCMHPTGAQNIRLISNPGI